MAELDDKKPQPAEPANVGSDPGVPIYEYRTPEEIAQRLQGSSIEEVLRIQDQLAKFVRERYEKPVAVLFSDIAGSTAYFEKYGDAEGRRMIQRHNDLLIPVIQNRGGRVVKTIGDALMATFPSANLAVDAAIGMQQAVYEANARVSHEEERFEIRIGVNFGTALVNDKDGDVYGDMVNVAARVQSQAGKGQIFVSDVVREYLSPTVPLKAAGTFQLKGKSQEFALYDVQWRELSRPDIQLEKPNLGGRYVVLDLLGSGGMASVWRARDEKLGRDVAVKVLHGHMQMQWATRERFQREAVVAASLVHENIVQVYDYASQGADQSFIAMELVEGEHLRMFLERAAPLPSVAALLVGHEIARGLAFAHARQVIHRDLKPENVLVSRTGAVKIADFGIAGVGEMVRLTQSGAQVGTPAYLSPEQVRGNTATTRSDVFALGVILYEMSTGRSPFGGDSSAAVMFRIVEGSFAPPERVASVDADLAGIIRKCLARDPEHRYASAAEVVADLAQALNRREVGDPRASLTRYFTDGALPKTPSRGATDEAIATLRKTKSRAPLYAGLTVAVAALAIGGGLFLRSSSGSVQPSPALTPAPATAPQAHAPPPSAPRSGIEPSAPPSTAAATANAAPQATSGSTSAGAAAPGASAPLPNTPPESPPARAAAAPAPAKATRTRPAVKPASGAPASKLSESAEEKVSSVGERKVSEFGTLRLTVSGGWADIKIDGVKMGRYPTQRVFTLPEGAHVLELTGNEARAPYRARVTIAAGATLEHRAELQPVAP